MIRRECFFFFLLACFPTCFVDCYEWKQVCALSEWIMSCSMTPVARARRSLPISTFSAWRSAPKDIHTYRASNLHEDLFSFLFTEQHNKQLEQLTNGVGLAHHSRAKRSTAHIANNEYTIEVLVAVDKKMQEYHRDTLKSYVLTLMSIVSSWQKKTNLQTTFNDNLSPPAVKTKRVCNKLLHNVVTNTTHAE